MKNTERQPSSVMISTTIGGAIAAPRRLALWVMPCTKPRSLPRIPELHRAGGARKRAGLADAEQEAHDDERDGAEGRRRSRRS